MIVDVRKCLIEVKYASDIHPDTDEHWRIITGKQDTYYVEPRKWSWEVDSVEEFERDIEDINLCGGKGFLEIETDHSGGDFAKYTLEGDYHHFLKENGHIHWGSVLC